MPRINHVIHTEHPYHVSARSHDGVWFNLPTATVWEVMTDYLYLIQKLYEVRIHSFVLMSNHFHMLISTPGANLSGAMNHFMRETSKEINRLSGKRNQVYGGRYFRSLIMDDLHFAHVYKYIYRNPVTAGLSKRCETYEFSTLRGLLGRAPAFIPLAEDRILFEEGQLANVIEWLNEAPKPADYRTLRRALRHRILAFPLNRWSNERHTLETQAF